jgi:hypothetical protein
MAVDSGTATMAMDSRTAVIAMNSGTARPWILGLP